MSALIHGKNPVLCLHLYEDIYIYIHIIYIYMNMNMYMYIHISFWRYQVLAVSTSLLGPFTNPRFPSCCEITIRISPHEIPKRWSKTVDQIHPFMGKWRRKTVEIPTTSQLNHNKHRLKNWIFISTSTFLNDVPVKLPGHVGWYPQYISLFPCYNPMHFIRVSMAAYLMSYSLSRCHSHI